MISLPINPCAPLSDTQIVTRSHVRNRNMHTKNSVFTETRTRLVALLDYERRSLGSAEAAVKAVSIRIGATQGWVRRIVGRYGEAAVHGHLMRNIEDLHERFERRATASVGTPADLARRIRSRIEANLIDEEDRAS